MKEQLKKDTGFRAQFLPHYLRAKSMRPEIERWMADIRSAELYREAVEKAGALLPAGTITDWPAVSFVIFAPDSRGYDPVVLDALFCMDMGGGLADMIGHEFHHNYRGRFVDLTQDQATLRVIGQIHAEGTADLIDKAEWTRRKEEALTPRERDFVKLYRESPSVIRTMDDLLSRMSGMRTGRGDLGFQLRRASLHARVEPDGHGLGQHFVARLDPHCVLARHHAGPLGRPASAMVFLVASGYAQIG